jgi:serine/threonine protein kinase
MASQYDSSEGKQEASSTSAVTKLPDNLTLSDFELGKTVGTGSFGRVCVATHRSSKTFWAIKQLMKTVVLETQQV